jgi:DNA-binding transcriptional MerR regulator
MARTNLKRLEEGKLYYSISEVCAMTGLEQHVLRYWESEFPQLRPKKNRSGNRAYRAKEIKVIRYIRHLLYEEMFTIPGAKKKMADANLADLDGQLSLLRMVDIPPVPPAAARRTGNGSGDHSAGGPESIPGGGPEALRQELVRVKQELQDLLRAFEKLRRSEP